MHHKFLSLLASLSVIASAHASLTWSPAPGNNNLADSANYSPAMPSLNGEDLVFGDSNTSSLRLNGATLDLSSITFSEATPVYMITLSGSTINLSGTGILAPNAPGPGYLANRFTLENNSAINLSGSASLDYVYLLNTGGQITFADTSSAGNAVLHNSRQGATIRFDDNASAGNATLVNLAASTAIIFAGNSTLSNATINNVVDSARLILEGNNTLGAGNFTNIGNGTSIILNGNTTLETKGNDTITRIGSANGQNGTYAGNAQVLVTGNLTTANNTGVIYFNATSNFSKVIIAPGEGNKVFFNNTNTTNASTTRFNISNNATSLLLDGTRGDIEFRTRTRFMLYGNGTSMEIRGNVVIAPYSAANALVNNGILFSMNGTNITALITGNETASPSITSARFRNDYTSGTRALLDSVLTISGHSEIINSKFSYGTHVENNPSIISKNNTINIVGNALVSSSVQSGTSSANFIINGVNNRLFVGENATIHNATIEIGTSSGTNSTSTGDGISINNFLHITNNARISEAVITMAAGSGMLIDGNVTLNGTTPYNRGIGFLNAYSNADSTITTASITIGGNVVIDTFRVNMATTNIQAITNIRDNVDMSKGYVRLTGNATHDNILDISMAEGRPLEIHTINGTYGRINFSGEGEQTLVFGQNQSQTHSTYLTFTESDNAIGSVTLNLNSYALTLNRSNTITGNLTLNSGTLTLNHTQAVANTTLVINGGTLNYGTAIGTQDLTLGGLAGNATLDTSRNGTRAYFIGNNSRDSIFTGTINGTGNITKIGDGVLTLDQADLGSYTGQIAIRNGTLAINAVDLSSVTGVINVTTNAALRVGQGQSLINTLSLENDAILDIAVSKTGGTLSNGKLYVTDLQSTDMGELVYRATVDPNGQALASGDIITAFLTTNDTNILAEGEKDYGKVRSTNTRSFLMNSTANGSNIDFNLEVLTNSLADYANNPNQASIAGALDAVVANHPSDPLAKIADTTNDVGALIDTMNPAGLSSMSRLVYQQTNSEIDLISTRLDMQRHLNSALRENGQISDAILRVSSNIQSFQIPAAILTASTKPIPAPGAKASEDALPYQQTFWSGYVAVTASYGKMDDDKDAAGYDYHQAGLSIGLDKTLGNNEGLAGFQLSYHHGKSELGKPSEGTVKLNSLRLAGYTGFITPSGISLQGHAALSYHDYETERVSFDHDGTNIGLGKSTGDTKGYGAAISGELVKIYTLTRNLHWKHGPYARLTYDYLCIDSYDENGTATALHIDKQTPDSLRSTLGWKLWHENTSISGTTLLLNARLGWTHEYNNPNQSIHARFAQYDAGFTVRGPNTRRDSLTYGLSAQWLFASGRFVTLQYQGDLNDDQSTHFINAVLGWKF